MNILPIDIKRRLAFIEELRLLRDLAEHEIEYLREMADHGEAAFWEGVGCVCGEKRSEYILNIAEKSERMVKALFAQMGAQRSALDPKQSDAVLGMIQWHMIGVCAQELAGHENPALDRRINEGVERTLDCLKLAMPLGSEAKKRENTSVN